MPPYMSNLITFTGAAHVEAQLAAIRSMIEVDGKLHFSVKDGFHCLDLASLGFEVLFHATWIYRVPRTPLPDEDDGLEWSVVHSPAAIAEWEQIWRGTTANADARGHAPIFLPSLLRDPDFHFLLGKRCLLASDDLLDDHAFNWCWAMRQFVENIGKAGFPFEHHVSSAFRARGWTVHHGRYYVDDISEDVREIDLVADKSNDVDEVEIHTVCIVRCKKGDTNAWVMLADGVMRKRPWRTTIFEHFVAIVVAAPVAKARVLELGSGPGFLAEQLLAQCPTIVHYTLLDFSEAMLEQSRRRLNGCQGRTEFLRADFKSDTWPHLVSSPVDFVVSLQAVHELRHKRHAARLYAQIAPLLGSSAEVLICDHLPPGAHTPRHRVLYMTTEEKLEALTGAGLVDARVVWRGHNMALYRARANG